MSATIHALYVAQNNSSSLSAAQEAKRLNSHGSNHYEIPVLHLLSQAYKVINRNNCFGYNVLSDICDQHHCYCGAVWKQQCSNLPDCSHCPTYRYGLHICIFWHATLLQMCCVTALYILIMIIFWVTEWNCSGRLTHGLQLSTGSYNLLQDKAVSCFFVKARNQPHHRLASQSLLFFSGFLKP